jgi:hypothetical protein
VHCSHAVCCRNALCVSLRANSRRRASAHRAGHAIEGCTTTPSQATVLRAETATLSLRLSLTHAQVWTILAMIVDLCRWLNKQAASWPRMLKRDMTLTLISTQFAAADPVSLRCVATIESCDCQCYVKRRQVCLSVPAIDARGGSQILVLNALQATRRDTTGLPFG